MDFPFHARQFTLQAHLVSTLQGSVGKGLTAGKSGRMQSLRILHVASHDRIASGGSIQFLRAAREQRIRGHTVSCVMHRKCLPPWLDGRSRSRLSEADLSVSRLGMRGVGRSVGLARMRGRLAAGARLDVVHVHRERALEFVLDATVEGTPGFVLVVQRGNSNPLSSRHRKLLCDPRVDGIIAVAGEVRDRLLEGGVPEERIRVIYGSVDPERFHPGVDGSGLRRELGIPSDAPIVGILANLDAKKDHRTFLQACARVHRARPEARFVMVGRGDAQGLRTYGEELGLGGEMVFAGYREDVPECLAAFDVSVNSSSRSEGLSGSIRESLAMARPVVCTGVGGNTELVVDGRTGTLVEPENPEALAEGILRALDRPEEAEAMARRGHDLVLKEMHPDVRQSRLEALYRELLSARRRDLRSTS